MPVKQVMESLEPPSNVHVIRCTLRSALSKSMSMWSHHCLQWNSIVIDAEWTRSRLPSDVSWSSARLMHTVVHLFEWHVDVVSSLWTVKPNAETTPGLPFTKAPSCAHLLSRALRCLCDGVLDF